MWKAIKYQLGTISLMECIGLFLAFAVGYLCVRFMTGSKTRWLRTGLAFPTGFGIASIWMTLLAYAEIRLTTGLIAGLMSATIIVFAGLQWKSISDNIRGLKNWRPGDLFVKRPISITYSLLIAVIVIILSVLLLKSVYWQPISWDVITSFDLNAKAIFHEGKLLHSLYYEDNGVGVGVVYTPLISMSFAYLYFFDFMMPKIYPPLILISFTILFYGIMRRYSNRIWSALITLFWLLTPEFISHGAICQTNLTLALFGFAAPIALRYWVKNDFQMKFLALAYLMGGLASWTRNEGIIVIGMTLLFSVYMAYRNKRSYKVPILGFLLAFAPFVSWTVFRSFNAELFAPYTQASISASNLTFIDPEKLSALWEYTKAHTLAIHIFGVTFYGVLLFLALSMLYALYRRRKKKPFVLKDFHVAFVMMIFLWLSYLFLLYELTYLRDLDDQVGELRLVADHSYKRFLFLIVPFAWFFIGTNDFSLFISKKLNRFLYGRRAEV